MTYKKDGTRIWPYNESWLCPACNQLWDVSTLKKQKNTWVLGLFKSCGKPTQTESADYKFLKHPIMSTSCCHSRQCISEADGSSTLSHEACTRQNILACAPPCPSFINPSHFTSPLSIATCVEQLSDLSYPHSMRYWSLLCFFISTLHSSAQPLLLTLSPVH